MHAIPELGLEPSLAESEAVASLIGSAASAGRGVRASRTSWRAHARGARCFDDLMILAAP